MKILSLVVRKYMGVMGLSILFGLIVFVATTGSIQRAQAASAQQSTRTFTIRNNCSNTIYPAIYPPIYQNGGWSMAPGASVSFPVANGFSGRVWGRTGCNGASPAQCATGQCGGTGLQCAGTTGQPNTSLAEFTINSGGTDWYNVSYVDAFSLPVGIRVSNGSCVSPNSCSNAVLTNCPADLRSGSACLSPCTRYNTDQYCCRGAYGTAATCIVSQWAPSARAYVNNVHTYCPKQYSYAYDEVAGDALHTCATGTSYTITFCPSGGGGGGPTPTRTRTPGPGPTRTPTPGGGTGFNRGVVNVSSTQARPWFQPVGWTAGYVILHYIRPGLSQQNVQMSYNSGASRWEYTVGGMSPGQTLQYQFTYQRNGLQYDTAWFSWVKP